MEKVLQDPMSVLAKSSDPLLLCDGNGAIVWNNTASARFFRFPELSVVDVYEILAPEHVKTALAVEHYCTFDATVARGKASPVKQSVVAISVASGSPGQNTVLLAFFSRASESAAITRQSEFLESVAHDLKNPLGAIFGYVDALLDTSAGEGLLASHVKILSRIRTTSLRSLEMVRNCQQLMQLHTEPVVPANRAHSLNTIVQSVLSYTWREEAGLAKLRTTLSSEPVTVRAKPAQLERIVANLVSNAVKYTPSDGTIHISTERLGGYARLEVHNTGTPIPAERLALLFERYERAEQHAGIQGSGLGLYLVKQLVSGLGGTVTAKSSRDKGTSFEVALPAAD